MANNVKIVEQLSPTKFVIEVTPAKKPKHVSIAHDYVEFGGRDMIFTDNKARVALPGGGSTNYLSINTNVQIPIRAFKTFILEHLNNAEYLQDEHFKDREKEDGTKYPPYAYYHNISIKFYDKENKQHKVAIWEKGDKVPSIVTLSFYEKHIAPTLL